MNKYQLYFEQIPWRDPEKVFLALFSGQKNTFWLDNQHSPKAKDQRLKTKDHFTYMGSSVKSIKYNTSNHSLSISNNTKTKEINTNIFTYLKEELSSHKLHFPAPDTLDTPDTPDTLDTPDTPDTLDTLDTPDTLPFEFTGGFIGCFTYEMDAHFLFVDNFLAFDHKEKKVYLVALTESKKEATHWFSKLKIALFQQIAKLNNLKFVEPRRNPAYAGKFEIKNPLPFSLSRSKSQYLKDIRTCQNYLKSGHAYQICLTNQITTNINTNWLSLYLALRQTNPAPYNAYINFGDFALLSSSPELFLHVDNKRNIVSQPMKGTVPRGNTPQEDKILKNRLGKTLKDYAENIMIVDLVRNDLGRVCEFGSIKVTNPLSVQTYPTVHQLVSTITGKLRPDKTIIDAIRSAFPGGSMTGTPKIRAMEIISEIEKQPRGIYSGTFGYLSLNGTASLAMTIRTIIAAKNHLSFGTGGAILTDSIPEQEYDEMLLKAKALIEAITKTTGAKTYRIIGR